MSRVKRLPNGELSPEHARQLEQAPTGRRNLTSEQLRALGHTAVAGGPRTEQQYRTVGRVALASSERSAAPDRQPPPERTAQSRERPDVGRER